MARKQVTDFLMNNRFHLLDVSLSIPPVLIPIWGFSSISAPEMTVEYREIKEGNYEFPRKVVERAAVSDLTLENGSQLFNSGFWDWINKMPEGLFTKKNMLLIHFSNVNPGQYSKNPNRKSETVSLDIKGTKGMAGGDIAVRLPGKAWLLKDCAPSRYKVGSDFTASGGQISLQSLDLKFEEFIEFNVGIGGL